MARSRLTCTATEAAKIVENRRRDLFFEISHSNIRVLAIDTLTTRRAQRRVAYRSPISQTRHCDYTSQDKHRVAIAIEPVPLGDRVPVCLEDELAAGESGDEHQERR